VVEGISFDIKRGETLALVGESGSGKSVTAHSILRLLPYPWPAIRRQHPLCRARPAAPERKTMRHIRGNRIAMIFQEPMTSLNPLHSIEKQINEVLGMHKG
jgi:microcin C transport system ATP-binding protein